MLGVRALLSYLPLSALHHQDGVGEGGEGDTDEPPSPCIQCGLLGGDVGGIGGRIASSMCWIVRRLIRRRRDQVEFVRIDNPCSAVARLAAARNGRVGGPTIIDGEFFARLDTADRLQPQPIFLSA